MLKDIHELSNGRWRLILTDAGIDEKYLVNHHGPCPCCGGKDRFRFDDKGGRGTFFCSNCRAGDGFKLLELTQGWAFKESADFIRKLFDGIAPQNLPKIEYAEGDELTPDQLAKRRATLKRTWEYARKVSPGDPVWKYLVKTRKLPLVRIPQCLRYHPRFPYYEGKGENRRLVGKFPMMLAKVSKDGKAVNLHRTYITPEGEKAPVECPKKLMEGLGVTGGAIRLTPAGKRLAIAEGIESALAVTAITGIPCWAAISATIMPNVIVPESVTDVVIFADHDIPDDKGRRAGQEGAKALADRLRAEGKNVQVVIPSKPGTDFHDVWLERLGKKQKRAASKPQTGARPVAMKVA